MKHCVQVIFCLSIALTSFSQKTNNVLSLKDQASFVEAVEKKLSRLDRKVQVSSNKLLHKISREEYRIYKKIRKDDSVAAKKFLSASQAILNRLSQRLDGSNPADSAIVLKQYIPAFDTIKTSLSFLSKQIPGNGGADAFGPVNSVARRFELRLQAANEIKKELNERKKKLVDELKGFSVSKELKAYSKSAYYYQQELNEWKETLKVRKKAERKVITLLSKNEKFKAFIKEHGMLAKMFGLPNGQPAAGGMQTRQSVSALILQRFAGTGGNPQEQVEQQISLAQQSLNEVKKKLNAAKQNNSSDVEMPAGFKPNTQKKKSLFQRFEYGLSFQTQKLNSYFPATADISLSLGYKLNDRSTMGIGAAYKLGLGKDWNNIDLTNEGVALRSFVDIKLKGGLWLTGGYEQNHFKRFSSLQQLSSMHRWNQSGLLGLTRKIALSKNRTSKIQLLYDFMFDKNKINAQPLIFRIGYNF